MTKAKPEQDRTDHPLGQVCRNCGNFYQEDVDRGGPKGKCLFLPPPFLRALFSLLHSEPALGIDYEGVYDGISPQVSFDEGCGSWTPQGAIDTGSAA